MSRSIRIYIGCVVAAGAVAAGAAIFRWSCPDPVRFAVLLGLTAVASLVKLRLPGITGTYSLNAILLVVGITYFRMPEAVAAAVLAVALQQFAGCKCRPTMVQFLFNAANETASVAVCSVAAHGPLEGVMRTSSPAVLALVAALYFVVNTVIVSGVLSLLQGKPLRELCRQWYYWSFPYYLLGVAVVGLIPFDGRTSSAESWLVLLPLLYLVHFFSGLPLRRDAEETADSGEADGEIPHRARVYIAGVTTVGMAMLVSAVMHWESADPVRFLACLALAVVTATWKVRLPRMTGTISVNFVMTLFAIAALSLPEALVMSGAGAVVQSLWKPRNRPKVVQVAFNAASFILSTALAYSVCRLILPQATGQRLILRLAVATALQYGLNTLLVAGVLCLVEDKPVLSIWRHCYFWSFPYYVVGATAAGLMAATNGSAGWIPSLFILPLLALVYVSYASHLRGREAV
jgi:hypothetical protein